MPRPVLLVALLCLALVPALARGQSPASSCPTSVEVDALWRINQQRAQNGLPPYQLDARLVVSSRLHSQDMAARAYFSHVSPDGVTFDQRIRAAGYPSPGGETIAAGYATPTAAIDGWMSSAGHRALLLHASLRHIGLGVATGGPYGIYWTANFGSSSAAPDNVACQPGVPGKPGMAGGAGSSLASN
jgi:uncharacterized protein YkwD